MFNYLKITGVILASVMAFSIHRAATAGLGVKPNSFAKSPNYGPATKAAEVQPNRIVVKFREGHEFGQRLFATGVHSFDELTKIHHVYRLERLTKGISSAKLLKMQSALSMQRIYYAYFHGNASPVSVARELSQDPLVEYAEPLYYHTLFDTPNDPDFNQQSHFDIISVELAWDVVKGEQGNVIVAVIDGGTNINHPDIAGNLWRNPGEVAGNGIDDDDNGFVDDVMGWNFANNSNDPTGLSATPGNADHGTITAGIACAVTDNGEGVAGTSWNAKLMAINAASATEDNVVDFGYAGLLYAVENGADIVNLSWGRSGPPSSFEREIIDFAHEMGVAIIAAAGNDGNSEPDYPAAYPNVLSVGATNSSDAKAAFSNYGTTVDIFAPGVSIISTLNNGGVGQLLFGTSGTSFSTPMAAGVVALVKTQNPDWLGIQASEQVRVTADNIDNSNPSFVGMLGKGRLNAAKAVTNTSPSIRITEVNFTESNGDGIIQGGETVEVLVKFINYLAPAEDITLSLTLNDPFATLVEDVARIVSLETLEETATPVSFIFDVSSTVPDAHILHFTIEMSSRGYEDSERFSLIVEPTFSNVAINNIQVSLTNVGRIGFANTEGQSEGIGFIFNNGSNLLFEGAIIAGTGPTLISNSARGIFQGSTLIFDKDFSRVDGSQLLINTPGALTDQESIAQFEDDLSNTPVDIRVTQESFAEANAPNNDFILLRYIVENQSGGTLENFHFGLFFDWDIAFSDENDVLSNSANYIASRKLGYVWFESIFVGVSFLSDENISYRSVDNNGLNFNINDGFTDEEKWRAISGGISTLSIQNKDVSHVMAAGPFNIAPNDFIQLGFTLVAGESVEDLQDNADAAKQLWDNLFITAVEEKPAPGPPSQFSLQQNYPNPFNPTTEISYEIAKTSDVELTIYNMLGQKIRTLVDQTQSSGIYSSQWDGKNDFGHNVASGVYFYQLTAGEFKQTQKMLLLQ